MKSLLTTPPRLDRHVSTIPSLQKQPFKTKQIITHGVLFYPERSERSLASEDEGWERRGKGPSKKRVMFLKDEKMLKVLCIQA